MTSKILLLIIELSIISAMNFAILQPFVESEVEHFQQQGKLIINHDSEDYFENKLPGILSDEDFIIKSDNTFIKVGSRLNELKADEKIVNIRYADEKHAYDVYSFENFTILSQPFDEGIIFSVYLTTSIHKTYRGISVGDTASDVFEKYGLVDDVSTGLCSYRYNDKILTFYVSENGKVTGIHFDSI